MNIFIIGMMGSGKTSIGKKLASLLNYTFIDIDKSMEEKEKKNINDLFKLWGEKEFRLQEHLQLRLLEHQQNSVISTGGGLPCYYNNMSLMNKLGETLYLTAESSFLVSRLIQGKNKRPLIADIEDDRLIGFLDSLQEKRSAFYKQAKHTIPSKNLTPYKIIEMMKINGLSF